jgi:hypothetical protein
MTKRLVLCGVALLGAIYAESFVPAAAAGIVCIPLVNILTASATDDKTILVKLRSAKYKRVDLAGGCPDLTVQGFSYATSTDDLCETDALRVNQSAGAVCMIKNIVDITKEDALALQKPKQR